MKKLLLLVLIYLSSPVYSAESYYMEGSYISDIATGTYTTISIPLGCLDAPPTGNKQTYCSTSNFEGYKSSYEAINGGDYGWTTDNLGDDTSCRAELFKFDPPQLEYYYDLALVTHGVCSDQCDATWPVFQFDFESNTTSGGTPASICVNGCTATKEHGLSLTTGSGDVFASADYQPEATSCLTETAGSVALNPDPDFFSFVFDFVDNGTIKVIKDTESCLTDSFSGEQTCVPLIEQGTGSITDEDGRDMTVNPQGQNCGTVNGVPTCVASNGTGIAEITDDEGNVYTIDNPKNPVDGLVVNNNNGDSDSSYTVTVNTSTGSTTTNSTNSTDGTTDGVVTDDQNTSAVTGDLSGTNVLLTNLGNKAVEANSKLDTLNVSTVAVKNAVDNVTTAVNANTDELKKITSPTDSVVPSDQQTISETTNSFYARLQNIPIVSAVSGININFGGSGCAVPSLNFSIMGTQINGDLSLVCDVMSDIESMLSYLMIFLWLLSSTFIFLKA